MVSKLITVVTILVTLGLPAIAISQSPSKPVNQSHKKVSEPSLEQILTEEELHIHELDSDKQPEHMAVLKLVPRDKATHIAMSHGSWFDPATWHNREVPGRHARVLIPSHVKVVYDDISDTRLFTVRVDGELVFAINTNSRMLFDTMVISPAGTLEIGTRSKPIQANVNVDLIVVNNGPIDTSWDPLLLSRGVVAHGKTSIHGLQKDSHEKVTKDPMAGDMHVYFARTPRGWRVGDTIIVAGTRYDGYKWDNDIRGSRFYPSEDEVRVITGYGANGRINFDKPLNYDHDTPRNDLHVSVANYTRNVSFETEKYTEAEVYERGHVMFMHSEDVDVRYAEFLGLGRTDKSEQSFHVRDFEQTSFASNVQGRYSLHLHRTGVDDLKHPAILTGNAVYDSPGWGFVHHDSCAILENNASFNTFGAGYVAETGNETGAWNDNIAIQAKGISWAEPKNTSTINADSFDTARGGDGFWFQGRLLTAADNIAASVNTGFVYFHRNGDQRMIPINTANTAYPGSFYGAETARADEAPILFFQDNETFAAREGLHIVKANPNQGHDVWSQLDGFTAWSVRSGAHLQYSSHYIFSDFDLIAKTPTPFSKPKSGISTGTNTSDLVITNARVSGFTDGIDLMKRFLHTDISANLHNYVVIDAKISDVEEFYANYDPAFDEIVTHDELISYEPNITLNAPLRYTDNKVAVSGTKYDGLGITEFPGGSDNFGLSRSDVVRLLQKDGYQINSSGEAYFPIDVYFTDRLTGDVFYETHPVLIPETEAVKLGRVW